MKPYKEDLKQVLRIAFYFAAIGAVITPIGAAIAWANGATGLSNSSLPLLLFGSVLSGGVCWFSIGFIIGLIYKLYQFAFSRQPDGG